MKALSYQSQAVAGRSRLELASVTAGRKTSLAPLMTFHPDINCNPQLHAMLSPRYYTIRG
jgi:hypothetical protein